MSYIYRVFVIAGWSFEVIIILAVLVRRWQLKREERRRGFAVVNHEEQR